MSAVSRERRTRPAWSAEGVCGARRPPRVPRRPSRLSRVRRHTRLAFDVVADNLHSSGIIPVTLGDAGSLPARAGQRYGGNA